MGLPTTTAPRPPAAGPSFQQQAVTVQQAASPGLAEAAAKATAERNARVAQWTSEASAAILGGRTPEQIAQARGIPLDQSNLLTQRIVNATVAQKSAMADSPPGTSGTVGYNAAKQTFGPIEPWVAGAMANERNALGGAPVPADGKTTGVTYDMNGQTLTAPFPAGWQSTFAGSLFTDVTQDPAHKDAGQYIPSPNLLPKGATQHSDGLEDIGGMLGGNSFNREVAPIVGAAVGTMIAPGIGTAIGASLGGLAQKGYDANSASKTNDSAGTGVGVGVGGTGGATGVVPGGVGAIPGGLPGGVGTERVASPTVSLATAAADVYAKSVTAQQAAQAADVVAGKVTAAQAALANAVTPEQIQAARAQLAAAVTAQQTTAAQIDQSKQAFFRDFQVKNVGALSDQAEGKGPSLAYAMFQKATDENLAAIRSQAAQARGGNVASAGAASIYATGNLQAKAAQDAGILRLKEQMDARQQLAAALESGRSGDIGLATKQADLTQTNDIANANRTLTADTANQENVRATSLANAGFQQQANVQNVANALNAALEAQKQANDNYKFNASEANRVALDNANREVQAAIANQTNARTTAQFNTDQSNTVGAANADRDLKAATTNQGNTSSNNQFNAGQTNNVNVAGYQGDISQRGTDIAAGLTIRGQDINAQTSRESLALGRDKQTHDENKDYIELAAAGAKGLTDAYATYEANKNKTTTPAKV